MEKLYMTSAQLEYLKTHISTTSTANDLLDIWGIKSGMEVFEVVIKKIGKIESTIKLEE